MNSLNLGGHSGCGIFLMEENDGTVFVRKISKDAAYNNRLQAQCAKQRSFAGSRILAPAVLREGIDPQGRFFFDMEYIQGVTLAEYIKTMEIGKIRGLVSTLVENLFPMDGAVSNKDPEVVNRVFKEKLDSLDQTLFGTENDYVKQAMEMLRRHDWSNIGASACHGDLTLENIIVKNDRMYLIDFLDSFYDSWLLDMGTLLQDVQALWSYRKEESLSMNTVLRLIVFRDVLVDTVGAINPIYQDEIYYALLLKLVRIYPYTTDHATLRFLDGKLQQIVMRLKSAGKEGLKWEER